MQLGRGMQHTMLVSRGCPNYEAITSYGIGRQDTYFQVSREVVNLASPPHLRLPQTLLLNLYY